MRALDAAWNLLKANPNSIDYDDTGLTGYQSRHPVIDSMVHREMERQIQQRQQDLGPVGATLEALRNPVNVVAALQGKPRNPYSDAAVARGARNYPTEGGPDNDMKQFLPQNKPRGYEE